MNLQDTELVNIYRAINNQMHLYWTQSSFLGVRIIYQFSPTYRVIK